MGKEKSSAEQSFELVKVLREIRNLMEIMLYLFPLSITYSQTGDIIYGTTICLLLFAYLFFRIKRSDE